MTHIVVDPRTTSLVNVVPARLGPPEGRPPLGPKPLLPLQVDRALLHTYPVTYTRRHSYHGSPPQRLFQKGRDRTLVVSHVPPSV